MFLRNAWYVAALDAELKEGLLPVKMLNERIVLYRKSNGEPVALEDACVHRKVPLSMGRIKGDTVECAYHGMTYDADGQCVRIPAWTGFRTEPACAAIPSSRATVCCGCGWVIRRRGPGRYLRRRALRRSLVGHHPRRCDDDRLQLPLHDRQFAGSLARRVGTSRFLRQRGLRIRRRSRSGRTESGVIASRWMRGVEVAPIYVPFIRFSGALRPIAALRSPLPESCAHQGRIRSCRRRRSRTPNVTSPPSSWTRTIS